MDSAGVGVDSDCLLGDRCNCRRDIVSQREGFGLDVGRNSETKYLGRQRRRKIIGFRDANGCPVDQRKGDDFDLHNFNVDDHDIDDHDEAAGGAYRV